MTKQDAMIDETTQTTRATIDRFYEAYLAGNGEGMLAEMADDAVVTFAGHGVFRGKDEIRRYMSWAGPQLTDLRFTVIAKIVDGERAAVPWDETARTKAGEPWAAIGCDHYRVVDGRIVELTCIGDTEKMKRLLEPWPAE
jgi:ketosteroid isomerase-like protein